MEIKIKITDDERKAFLTLVTEENEKPEKITSDELKNALSEKGVNTGIKENILLDICRNKRFNKEYVAAEGIPPQIGENAKIKIAVKSAERSTYDRGVDAAKKVDHYGVREGFIIYVKSGDLLAFRVPPAPGKNGKTVTGKDIEGILGKDISLTKIQGINTKIDGNNIFAAKDGIFNKKENKISVDQIITLPGDLNFATGSVILPLEADIELTVPGDIKSGFKVQCSKITVMGNIEDAQVTAKYLEVKRGIVGKSDLPIVADNLSADFITGSRKIRAKYLEVNKEITGGSKIFANFVRAKIIQECAVTVRYGLWADYLYGNNDILAGVDIDENEEYLVWIRQLKGVEKVINEESLKNRSLLKKEDAIRSMAERMPKTPSIQKELRNLNDLREKLQKFEKIKRVLKERLKLHQQKMYISGSPFILIRYGLTKDMKAKGESKQFNRLYIKEIPFSSSRDQESGLYLLKGQEVVIDPNYNINDITQQAENYKTGKY
ncbi:flagellar assembly protein A [candidate division KSB1 bacterium]